MIFDKVHILFRIRIRIHNLRILQKVSDLYGSRFGSTTLIGGAIIDAAPAPTVLNYLQKSGYFFMQFRFSQEVIVFAKRFGF
jgi:hypothetical protein